MLYSKGKWLYAERERERAYKLIMYKCANDICISLKRKRGKSYIASPEFRNKI